MILHVCWLYLTIPLHACTLTPQKKIPKSLPHDNTISKVGMVFSTALAAAPTLPAALVLHRVAASGLKHRNANASSALNQAKYDAAVSGDKFSKLAEDATAENARYTEARQKQKKAKSKLERAKMIQKRDEKSRAEATHHRDSLVKSLEILGERIHQLDEAYCNRMEALHENTERTTESLASALHENTERTTESLASAEEQVGQCQVQISDLTATVEAGQRIHAEKLTDLEALINALETNDHSPPQSNAEINSIHEKMVELDEAMQDLRSLVIASTGPPHESSLQTETTERSTQCEEDSEETNSLLDEFSLNIDTEEYGDGELQGGDDKNSQETIPEIDAKQLKAQKEEADALERMETLLTRLEQSPTLPPNVGVSGLRDAMVQYKEMSRTYTTFTEETEWVDRPSNKLLDAAYDLTDNLVSFIEQRRKEKLCESSTYLPQSLDEDHEILDLGLGLIGGCQNLLHLRGLSDTNLEQHGRIMGRVNAAKAILQPVEEEEEPMICQLKQHVGELEDLLGSSSTQDVHADREIQEKRQKLADAIFTDDAEKAIQEESKSTAMHTCERCEQFQTLTMESYERVKQRYDRAFNLSWLKRYRDWAAVTSFDTENYQKLSEILSEESRNKLSFDQIEECKQLVNEMLIRDDEYFQAKAACHSQTMQGVNYQSRYLSLMDILQRIPYGIEDKVSTNLKFDTHFHGPRQENHETPRGDEGFHRATPIYISEDMDEKGDFKTFPINYTEEVDENGDFKIVGGHLPELQWGASFNRRGQKAARSIEESVELGEHLLVHLNRKIESLRRPDSIKLKIQNALKNRYLLDRARQFITTIFPTELVQKTTPAQGDTMRIGDIKNQCQRLIDEIENEIITLNVGLQESMQLWEQGYKASLEQLDQRGGKLESSLESIYRKPGKDFNMEETLALMFHYSMDLEAAHDYHRNLPDEWGEFVLSENENGDAHPSKSRPLQQLEELRSDFNTRYTKGKSDFRRIHQRVKNSGHRYRDNVESVPVESIPGRASTLIDAAKVLTNQFGRKKMNSESNYQQSEGMLGELEENVKNIGRVLVLDGITDLVKPIGQESPHPNLQVNAQEYVALKASVQQFRDQLNKAEAKFKEYHQIKTDLHYRKTEGAAKQLNIVMSNFVQDPVILSYLKEAPRSTGEDKRAGLFEQLKKLQVELDVLKEDAPVEEDEEFSFSQIDQHLEILNEKLRLYRTEFDKLILNINTALKDFYVDFCSWNAKTREKEAAKMRLTHWYINRDSEPKGSLSVSTNYFKEWGNLEANTQNIRHLYAHLKKEKKWDEEITQSHAQLKQANEQVLDLFNKYYQHCVVHLSDIALFSETATNKWGKIEANWKSMSDAIFLPQGPAMNIENMKATLHWSDESPQLELVNLDKQLKELPQDFESKNAARDDKYKMFTHHLHSPTSPTQKNWIDSANQFMELTKDLYVLSDSYRPKTKLLVAQFYEHLYRRAVVMFLSHAELDSTQLESEYYLDSKKKSIARENETSVSPSDLNSLKQLLKRLCTFYLGCPDDVIHDTGITQQHDIAKQMYQIVTDLYPNNAKV